MLEKSGAGGWRKRIVHSRPSAAKLFPEDRALSETDPDSLRPPSERPSWRNTFHSRPGTPSRAPAPTISQFDTDDVRREITSDVPSLRKVTKPKLARYISSYRSIKDASKEPEFGEFWIEMPPPYTEYVDPMRSLQSVFSHMTTSPFCPIPLHYNSGILRVFEDYRKVREERARLENLLHETFEGYRAAERFYDNAEAEYQAEIRRLELVIARGTLGMEGLMRARRDSTVKRRRSHRKTTSYDHVLGSLEDVTTAQLDEQIRMRSQQVLLQRPVSPSSKMAILSRRLENAQSANNFTVGTPPRRDKKITLSRKVESELDLARLGYHSVDGSVPRSVDSVFSGNGDPLPDEVEPLSVKAEPVADLETFVALQELGSLVARKRGIDRHKFLDGLMQLYSIIPENIEHEASSEALGEETNMSSPDSAETYIKIPYDPEHIVRHVRSQPLLGSAQRRRRHFSFEPGDDQLAALGRKVKALGTQDTSNSKELDAAFSGKPISPLSSLWHSADMQKPSKIPSPIQRPAIESDRRESSNSSVRTVFQRPGTEERRDSRSSVLTAFRQNSSGSLRPVAQSRSSSVHTSRYGEGHSPGSASSLGVRRSFAAMAAARAVDQAENVIPKNVAAQPAS